MYIYWVLSLTSQLVENFLIFRIRGHLSFLLSNDPLKNLFYFSPYRFCMSYIFWSFFNRFLLIIIIIYGIKNIEPMFSLFWLHTFERDVFLNTNLYALLTNLRYYSVWFGDMMVESRRCLSGWYIRTILW